MLATRTVVVRLGMPERFAQVLGAGRCSTCGRISALDPCNRCSGRFVKLIKRVDLPPRIA